MLLSNITTAFSKKAINFNSIANLSQNAKLNRWFNLSLFRYWLLHCLSVLSKSSICTIKKSYLYYQKVLSVLSKSPICTIKKFYLYYQKVLSVLSKSSICTNRKLCLYKQNSRQKTAVNKQFRQ
jgi:hypothetical protein